MREPSVCVVQKKSRLTPSVSGDTIVVPTISSFCLEALSGPSRQSKEGMMSLKADGLNNNAALAAQ